VLQFASPGFDVTISELATTLIAGGRLVLMCAEERGGEALAELVRRQGVTHAMLPPVVLADLPRGAGRWWWAAKRARLRWRSARRRGDG